MLSEFKAIYVASKDADGRPLPNRDEVLEWLLEEMARAYGGATATQVVPGRGSWTTPTGLVLIEPILIVKSYCAAGLDNERLITLARELKERAHQESVAIETPAGLELV